MAQPYKLKFLQFQSSNFDNILAMVDKEKENWALFFLLLAVLRGSQLQLQVGFTFCGL